MTRLNNQKVFYASSAKKTMFISFLGEPENFENGGPIFRIGFPLKAAGGLTSTDFKNRRRLNNGEMFDPPTVKKLQNLIDGFSQKTSRQLN